MRGITIISLTSLLSFLAVGCGGGGRAPSYAGASTGETRAAMPLPAEPAPVEKRIVEHVIEPGDSLWKLARDYDASIKEIRQVNQIEGDVIIAGQTIKIPTTLPEGVEPGSTTSTAATSSGTTIDASTGLPPAAEPAPSPAAAGEAVIFDPEALGF